MAQPTPSESGLMGMSSFANLGRLASKGNKLATLISSFAFAFSAVSFYETVLKQPKISIHVPAVLHYGRDGGGDTEVFAIPLTVTNDGAQSGTVLGVELVIDNPKAVGEAAKSKTFYSAYMGEHPKDANATNRAFAPITVAGRASFSDTIRFYPQGNVFPHLITETGTFKMKLTVKTAAPSEPSIIDRLFRAGDPQPLTFERSLPYMSDQHLKFRRGTIAMHSDDWKPTLSSASK